MWGTVLSWAYVGEIVKVGLYVGTMLRCVYVGYSVIVGLLGGLC